MDGRYLGKVLLPSILTGMALFTVFAFLGLTAVGFQAVALAAGYLVMGVGIARVPHDDQVG